MSNYYDNLRKIRMRCESMILSILGVEAALVWWNSPNYAFDGKTPKKMLDTDPHRVYDYVIGHVDGYG